MGSLEFFKSIFSTQTLVPQGNSLHGFDLMMMKRSKAVAPAGGLVSGTRVRNGMFDPLIDPRALVVGVDAVAELATAIDKIVIETTKNGYELVPKFKFKCLECGKEYQTSKPQQCTGSQKGKEEELIECQSTMFRGPDDRQIIPLKVLFEHPNSDEDGDVIKSFDSIQRDLIYYLTVLDNFYLEVTYNYRGDPTEIVPLPAEYIRKTDDPRVKALKKQPQFHCPHCSIEKPKSFYTKEGTCRKCKVPLVRTAYVQLGEKDEIVARWGKKMIIEGSTRAWGTRLYGIPRTLAVWTPAQVIRWILLYQHSAYSNNKSPDKIVVFPGMNQEEVNRNILEMVNFKKIHPEVRRTSFLAVQQAPEVIKVMDSLVDLKAIDMMRYIRELISIRFGVSLNMLGVQTPGKLGKETETVEVSYDTIEETQTQLASYFNQKVLPLWKDEAGQPAITEWEYKLKSPKKDDELRKANIQQTKIATVTQLRGAGVKAELDENGEVVIKDWGALPQPIEPTPLLPPAGLAPEEETPAQVEITIQEVSLAYERAMMRRDRDMAEIARTKLANLLGQPTPAPLSDIEWDIITGGAEAPEAKEAPVALSKIAIPEMYTTDGYIQKDGTISKFASYSEEDSQSIIGLLKEALEQRLGYNVPDLVKKILESFGGSEGELETIVKTELHYMRVKQRMEDFKKVDPEGKGRYRWSGPPYDGGRRSSEICKEIKAQVPSDGLSMDDLMALVKKVSEKHMGPKWIQRDGQPHPNCRHIPQLVGGI